jgi:hypothetical protein
MRAQLTNYLAALFVIASLIGCAKPVGKPVVTAGKSTSTHKAVPPPMKLGPGEQVDYAGHRCGNPNLHIKTHLCLYPRR